MPFNGVGIFRRLYSFVEDSLNGIPAEASRFDAELDGMADALSDCLTRDGQSQPTANLPLGGFKIVGLADPEQAQDGATKNYVDTVATSTGSDATAAVAAEAVLRTASDNALGVRATTSEGNIAALQSVNSTGGALYYPSWAALSLATSAYSSVGAYVKGDTRVDQGVLWVNILASTGVAPPTLPTTSNANWQIFRNPLMGQAFAVPITDTGTHTDPADGTTGRPNTGIFSWQTGTSGTGPKYLFATDSALAKPYTDAAAASAAAAATSATNATNAAKNVNAALIEIGRGPAGGVNILDMTGRGTPNQAINSDGSINTSSAGNTLSDMMRVAPSTTYITRKAIGQLRMLDAASNYIGGSFINGIAAGGTFTTGATTSFVQISAPTSANARSEIDAGTVLPTNYLAPGFLDPASAQRMSLDATTSGVRRALGTYSLLDPSPNAARDGFALGGTGVPYALAGWFVTDFIDALATDQFIANFSSGTNGAAWYFEDKTWANVLFTISNGVVYGTPPAGAKFWRAQVNGLANKANYKAYASTTLPAGLPGFPVVDPNAQKRAAILASRASLDASRPNPRQLFNAADVTPNTAIANNGSTYAATNYSTTGFQEITGAAWAISGAGSGSGQVCYYDENYTILNSGTNYSITANTPFMPPAGAYYMRRTIQTVTYPLTSVYVYAAAYASGYITIASGNVAAGDWVSINGTQVTFVASGASGAQVVIGADAVGSIANLNTYVAANATALGATGAVSSTSTNRELITAPNVGAAGNAITLAKSGANISVSGATLTGGLPLSLGYSPFGGGANYPAAGKAVGFWGNSITNFYQYQPSVLAVTGCVQAFSIGHPGRSFRDLADTYFAIDFPNVAALNGAAMVWVTEGQNEQQQGSIPLGTVEDSATTATVCGKMRFILEGFLNLNPSLIVGFTGNTYRGYFSYVSGSSTVTVPPDTVPNSAGYTGAQLDDTIRDFCKRWSCEFSNWRGKLGASELTDVNNASNTGKKAHTLDGLHPVPVDMGRLGHMLGADTNSCM